ncbi:hypothetical protein [Gordoniibacillus kamchatkensis]|nr:hypothetical protein [Paenibacillus sp. VKM B-2647]
MAASSINEKRLFQWGEIWLDIRLVLELSLVIVTVYAARRLKAP